MATIRRGTFIYIHLTTIKGAIQHAVIQWSVQRTCSQMERSGIWRSVKTACLNQGSGLRRRVGNAKKIVRF